MKKPTVKLTENGTSSLYVTFLKITLLPLLLLGIVIVSYSAHFMSEKLEDEVKNELKGLGSSILASYDSTYPGDYSMTKNEDYLVLQKGDAILSYKYDMLKQIASENDVEISLFYSNTRVMSTIENESGNPFIGDQITSLVYIPVMYDEKEAFFNNVTLQGESYYSYYRPIFNSDGSCVGMIGIAKSADSVKAMVKTSVFSSILILILAVVITGALITFFTTEIVRVIKKIMDFLKEISKGNLNTNLDYIVSKRKDELGEMGRLTERVQFALRKLVERDPLTDLLNRRSGEAKMNLVQSKALQYGEDFCIAIGDIDFFKRFNDTYGHEAGDTVLKEVAKTLQEGMLGNGYTIRWGGEEFLLVFEQKDFSASLAILNHILDEIRSISLCLNDEEIHITMTFGIVAGDAQKDINKLISNADLYLYQGKENGRNQIIHE